MSEEEYDDVYDLLVIPPSDKPIYLVLKTKRYSDDEGLDYFYGEHTCPTNWTDLIVAIVQNGDPDPHGVAQFVRRVDAPKGDDDDIDDKLFDLFPEAFGEGVIVDGELSPDPLPPPPYQKENET